MFGRHILGDRVRSQVLLTLKTGDAFEGVLWDADRDAVVLRNAEQVDVVRSTSPRVVDGELVVLAADVAFMQILG
jgi:hypothetical protein